MADDFSNFSDAELLAIAGEDNGGGTTTSGGGGDFSSYSNEQLKRIAEAPASSGASGSWGTDWDEPAEPWDLDQSIKQFGSGELEGLLSTAGLGVDILSGALNTARGKPSFSLKYTAAAPKLVEPYLQDRDPQYRYARTMGSFIGPQVLLGGAGLVAEAANSAGPVTTFLTNQLGRRALTTAATAGAGSQVGTDIAPDSRVLPLLGALIGGASPSAFADLMSGVKSVLTPATANQVRGSAASTFRDATRLSEADIQAAMSRIPQDDLGRLMSTAEVTRNPGAAQLEKTLAAVDEPSRLYQQRFEARNAVRNNMLDQMSTVPAVNREGLGTELMTRAAETSGALTGEAQQLWSQLPRDMPIDVTRGQRTVRSILAERQGGLNLDNRVRTLANQFLEAGVEPNALTGELTSGALQDIRSDALATMRDANLTGPERRILSALSTEIDDSMARGLTGDAYDAWQGARDLTRTEREIFGGRTAGAYLTGEQARPATALQSVFKGDTQAVQEFRAAVGGNPATMEAAKRGVLDSIPRNVQGEITPAAMRNFVNANEGGIRELFGQDAYDAMRRIQDDLRSQASVQELATLASKGGSATAQKLTTGGWLSDLMNRKVGSGLGPLAKPFNAWREAIGQENLRRVQGALYEAMMDPAQALELSRAPTDVRIFNTLQRLWNGVREAGVAGGRGVGVELMRPTGKAGTQSPRETPSAAKSSLQSQSSGGLLRLAPGAAPGDSGGSAQALQTLVERPPPRREAAPLPPSNPASLSPISSSGNVMAPLVRAVQYVESRGRAGAESKKGALGVMQVMPDTAREVLRENFGVDESKISDAELKTLLKDPDTNRQIGTAYLNGLIERYDGDVPKALLAYNQGIGNVAKGEIGPQGRAYVGKVFRALSRDAT